MMDFPKSKALAEFEERAKKLNLPPITGVIQDTTTIYGWTDPYYKQLGAQAFSDIATALGHSPEWAQQYVKPPTK